MNPRSREEITRDVRRYIDEGYLPQDTATSWPGIIDAINNLLPPHITSTPALRRQAVTKASRERLHQWIRHPDLSGWNATISIIMGIEAMIYVE